MLMRRFAAAVMLSAPLFGSGCAHGLCDRSSTCPTVASSVPVVPAAPAPCSSCGNAPVAGAPTTAYSAPVVTTTPPSGGFFRH